MSSLKTSILVFLCIGVYVQTLIVQVPRQARLLQKSNLGCQGENSNPTPHREGRTMTTDDQVELSADIEREIILSAPSELELRFGLLGVNKWTLTGFLLAAIIFGLNNALGTGWAGEIIGFGKSTSEYDSNSGVSRETTSFVNMDLRDVTFEVNNDLDSRVQSQIEILRKQ